MYTCIKKKYEYIHIHVYTYKHSLNQSNLGYNGVTQLHAHINICTTQPISDTAAPRH